MQSVALSIRSSISIASRQCRVPLPLARSFASGPVLRLCTTSRSGILSTSSQFLPSRIVLSCRSFSSTAPRNEEKPRSPLKAVIEKTKEVAAVTKQGTKRENIYTIPNILTFTRLVAAPAVGWLVLNDYPRAAFGLFAYAGITDLVDGWIARKFNMKSVVGTVIDPMADKLLMTILTVTLAMKGALPVWLAVIILGRDVGLAISALYYRWISLPPPKTMTRYWDFSLPSAEVRPTTISKVNTALQLGLIGATMAEPLIMMDVSLAMMAFQYTVASTTVWSGLSYVFSNDAVRILPREGDAATKEEEKK
ncbi:hypothetical protein G7K_2858-t1 [Saitoella complicata NRRL Y-17804]|uniref:CDP-diacylglycerol--glycerol-3-phosphate 3-phosphatidyltransferase n=1 Tax=Saitoella complicata (strain BCRC 22490 / CBS 7301 / JCM 7358 / NBRC 10748 / NRRL Y-17804) TaxID=698492 RepID=A0A0E9NFU8_SAICN|nr:hypothetical protein G7K_2858-t1 [Saitoella complicata NRRL Y-17804]